MTFSGQTAGRYWNFGKLAQTRASFLSALVVNLDVNKMFYFVAILYSWIITERLELKWLVIHKAPIILQLRKMRRCIMSWLFVFF